MIFGMTPFTFLHTLISLIGIASGFVVMYGFLHAKRLDGWTPVFLASTVLTSVTGFGFPLYVLLPSHKIGILSLVILAVAIVARYPRRLAGSWRWIYVVCAALAQYFNVFVLVIQLFKRVPALQPLAPTQSEPPFAVAQLVLLALFVWFTIAALKRFRFESASAV
jgi:hypothetical protein